MNAATAARLRHPPVLDPDALARALATSRVVTLGGARLAIRRPEPADRQRMFALDALVLVKGDVVRAQVEYTMRDRQVIARIGPRTVHVAQTKVLAIVVGLADEVAAGDAPGRG